MITHHLNPAQREALQTWLDAEARKPRTPSAAYIETNHAMAKIPVGPKPSPRAIAMTATGFGKDEVVPMHGFHAVRDLPLGWAITNVHDSGGNHRIVNAAQALHTALWNYWGGAPGEALRLDRDVPFGSRLVKELLANKLVYP